MEAFFNFWFPENLGKQQQRDDQITNYEYNNTRSLTQKHVFHHIDDPNRKSKGVLLDEFAK